MIFKIVRKVLSYNLIIFNDIIFACFTKSKIKFLFLLLTLCDTVILDLFYLWQILNNVYL